MLGTDIKVSAQDGSLAQIYVQDGWRKADNGYWKATYNGTTYYYKMDNNGVLNQSSNGKAWNTYDGFWVDKSGRYIKVDDNTLLWSEDKGKMWVPVPDREWQGTDGRYYKMDGGWSVWTRERQ